MPKALMLLLMMQLPLMVRLKLSHGISYLTTMAATTPSKMVWLLRPSAQRPRLQSHLSLLSCKMPLPPILSHGILYLTILAARGATTPSRMVLLPRPSAQMRIQTVTLMAPNFQRPRSKASRKLGKKPSENSSTLSRIQSISILTRLAALKSALPLIISILRRISPGILPITLSLMVTLSQTRSARKSPNP